VTFFTQCDVAAEKGSFYLYFQKTILKIYRLFFKIKVPIDVEKEENHFWSFLKGTKNWSTSLDHKFEVLLLVKGQVDQK